MDTRDDPTIVRTNATAFEPPALVPIGDVENVVLGLPIPGDEHFGLIPPGFEFQEDDDEDGVPPADGLPR